jgi:predicted Zn finger-like uncharacterized protein
MRHDSPMLISCPSCATSYDVDLPAHGRQVRCARCRTVWRAEPSHADKLMLAAAALAPEPQPNVPMFVAEPFVDHAADAVADGQLGDFQPVDERAPAPALVAYDEAGVDESRLNVRPADMGYSDAIEAPPIVPVDLDEDRPLHRRQRLHAPERREAKGAQDVESMAARRRSANRSALRWPLSRLNTGVLALALLVTILVGWRSSVVRMLPQTASFYALLGLPVNLRGLVFDNVATVTEQHEGVPILVVEGSVMNPSRKTEDVPRLKFVLRNAAHQEIYSWTAVPTRGSLPPGESAEFHSRLASPPADARDVVVRFVNRRDLIAAAH